ncbi:MAG: choice-of-anchor D domain-containing protein [Micavibrio sp.]
MKIYSRFRYGFFAAILSAAVFQAASALAQSAFDDPGSRTAASGVSGDIRPVADKVEAGEIQMGSTSQVVVLFRNDDNKPLKTNSINLYPSSNIAANVGENQCLADAIQPGEVCAVSLEVKGLQRGAFRIEMLMRHEGRTRLLTTTVNGTVASTTDSASDLNSEIETIPPDVDFGTLDASGSQTKAIILRNKTSQPIDIESIDVETGSQSGFSVNSNCTSINTGAACVVAVKWEPQQKGATSGSIIVRHSGATELTTVNLSGTYNPTRTTAAELFPEAVPGKGLLITSRENIDFGTGVAQSSSITSSLVNVGDVPLTLTDIRMANAENGVQVERNGCSKGMVLAPLDACPLTLTWEPVREGGIVDDVQVMHTGTRGVLVMPIRGSAARAINKDAKTIMLSGTPGADAILSHIQPLSIEDMGGEDSDDAPASVVRKARGAPAAMNVRGVLDGYVITSYSARRAIISGPGGSRVVFDGERSVIGGVLWEISIRPSAIEFQHGEQKVLLLFDKSLSSFNVLDAQSSSGNASLNNIAQPESSSSATSIP